MEASVPRFVVPNEPCPPTQPFSIRPEYPGSPSQEPDSLAQLRRLVAGVDRQLALRSSELGTMYLDRHATRRNCSDHYVSDEMGSRVQRCIEARCSMEF